ncbi:uncharacterized protein LOC117648432 [Thrips palmi]|uniref:Uncharacterized protein LOC117648432 n=1 Tax=Thrips palmi TaxID=161013 RepID=A0A6P8ZCV9_THRPL|nr:uncharacterized protein LOC117648432 [Thrips palmi]
MALQALRRCPGLGVVRLERCRGPGPVLHCGTFTPKSVTILDTPVSKQLVELLANACPGSRLEDCTITSNVEQAAVMFASVLKMALVADGKVPEQLKALQVTLLPPGPAADAKPGVLKWKRLGLKGTMSYNRVELTALFSRVND